MIRHGDALADELIARDPDLARTFWSGANATEGLRHADDERRRREAEDRTARSECVPDEDGRGRLGVAAVGMIRCLLLALVLVGACGVPADDEPTALRPLEPTTSTPVTFEPGEAFVVATTAPPTTPAPRPPPTHASRGARPGGGGGTAPTPAPSATAPTGGGLVVSSTAYCLTGHMANGRPAHRGAVAANRWPLGTKLRVSPSPVGELVTVEDRIGHGSELDFALPGDCGAARAWGRRSIHVEVVD